MTRNKYGLIGYPLSHSFSPKFFKKKFERESIDAEYKAYEIEKVEQFLEVMKQGVLGLNVTIPYKEKVLPFLDRVEPSAAEVGAVNTIKNQEGKLVGYNTDVYGFSYCLRGLELPFDFVSSKALILGTGGASKAVQYALESLGVSCDKVSRTGPGLTYGQLTENHMLETSIIVNTTPLGMYPKEANCPAIPLKFITNRHLVFDLIYNPEKTVLLTEALQRGAIIKNGAEMLVLQAERSWEIWNNHKI